MGIAQGDLQRFDGVETVTVTFLGRQGNKVLEDVTAFRRNIGRKFSQFSNVNFMTDDMAFSIPVEELDGNELRPNDQIKDANGVTYFVLIAELLTFRTRWRCACRKLPDERNAN